MKRLPSGLILLGMLALPILSPAADDGERETSVYDKHPECTERSEGAPRLDKCILQTGPPNHQGIATRNPQTQGNDQLNAVPRPQTSSEGSEGTTMSR